jgi:hypothetical protein
MAENLADGPMASFVKSQDPMEHFFIRGEVVGRSNTQMAEKMAAWDDRWQRASRQLPSDDPIKSASNL